MINNWFYQYMDEAVGDEAGGGVVDTAVSTESGDADVVAQMIEGGEEPSWFLDEGKAGEGDAPEWFKSAKYKTVSEQAKAYSELEKRFGSFSGAPESYEVVLSEELTEAGVSIDTDDPLVEQAMEMAKEWNMSQEGFNGMLELYAMNKLAEAKADEEHRQAEINALGKNAQVRIDNINKWASKNFDEETYQGFQELVQTAAGVKAVERMISMTRNAPVAPESSGNLGITEAEVRQMYLATDANGNRLIQTDPVHKEKYERMRDAFYQGREHRQIVG